jgi:hypothetical protein
MAAPTRAQKQLQKQMQLQLSKQPTDVEEWLKAKVLFPKQFGVNEQGDLLAPPIQDADRVTTIPIVPKVPATLEYINTYFTKRKESLQEPEEIYTKAKRNLRVVMEEYKKGLVPVSDVIDANRNVQDAECKLNSLAKLPRFIRDLTETLEERDLTLQHYDVRKMAEPVFQAMYTTIPWDAFWMTASAREEEERNAELLTQQQQEEGPITGSNKPKRTFTPKQRAIIAANRAKVAARF